jgi:hypothetical protein
MKQCVFGLFLIAAASACGGGHGPGDAGACVNDPACDCNDGRHGYKVCDVDTHAYVMCECDPGAQPAASNTGPTRSTAADGGMSPAHGAAGRMATASNGQPQSDAGIPDAGAGSRGNGNGRGNGGRPGKR